MIPTHLLVINTYTQLETFVSRKNIQLSLTFRHSRMMYGMNSSDAQKSFENLFKMFPERFISKNVIGALITFVKDALCTLIEHLLVTVKK